MLKSISYCVLFLATLMSYSGIAQIDYPMISEDNIWEIRTHCNEDVPFYRDLQLSYLKDSVVNGDSVNIFYRSDYLDDYESYFYENDHQVYMARDYANQPLLTDSSFILIYDFSLQVGDTFVLEDKNAILDYGFVGKRDTTILVLDAIDSIQVFTGEFRRRFNFEILRDDDWCASGDPYVWIDGIGYPGYPFLPEINDCFECGFTVDCFTYQGERIFYDCVFNSVVESLIPEVNIYPNPIIDNFVIETESKIVDVMIYDIQGHYVAHQLNDDMVTFSSALESGLYYAQIRFRNGQTVTKKFVK